MRRILVAAPHPDDEWIGCGGSLLKHIRRGNPVTVVYMTSGEAGGLGRTREALAAVREAEAREAAAFAGITDLIFLGNPDGYLAYDRSNLVGLVEIVRRIRP
ncbi:MAG: PIG-L family deacetylase, partial [Syntrophales bacterium]|nr:PIG-L family deacetylase [Syntrophales bacterium]